MVFSVFFLHYNPRENSESPPTHPKKDTEKADEPISRDTSCFLTSLPVQGFKRRETVRSETHLLSRGRGLRHPLTCLRLPGLRPPHCDWLAGLLRRPYGRSLQTYVVQTQEEAEERGKKEKPPRVFPRTCPAFFTLFFFFFCPTKNLEI